MYCRAEGWWSGRVSGPARASRVSRAGLEVSDITGRCAGGSWAARRAESLPARCLDSYLSNRSANSGGQLDPDIRTPPHVNAAALAVLRNS